MSIGGKVISIFAKNIRKRIDKRLNLKAAMEKLEHLTQSDRNYVTKMSVRDLRSLARRDPSIKKGVFDPGGKPIKVDWGSDASIISLARQRIAQYNKAKKGKK